MQNLFENGDNNVVLMTPEAFQAELVITLETYRTGRKPEALRVKAEIESVAPAKDVLEEFKQQPGKVASDFWGRFKAKAQNVASDLSENLATHSAATKLCEAQMSEILRKNSSRLKKMTDLAILFHGLFLHVHQNTNSVSLIALLTEFNAKLWAGTPDDDSGEKTDQKTFKARFYTQICNAALYFYNKGYSDLLQSWEQRFECVEPGQSGFNLDPHSTKYIVIWPSAWMGETYTHHLAQGSPYVVHNDKSQSAPAQFGFGQPMVVQNDNNSSDSPASGNQFQRDEYYDRFHYMQELEDNIRIMSGLVEDLENQKAQMLKEIESLRLAQQQSSNPDSKLKDIIQRAQEALSNDNIRNNQSDNIAQLRLMLNHARSILNEALVPEEAPIFKV